MKLTIEIKTDTFEDELLELSIITLQDVIAHTLPEPILMHHDNRVHGVNGERVGYWEWK